jgi:uncharacterized protein YggE
MKRVLATALAAILIPAAASAQATRSSGISVQGVGIAQGVVHTVRLNVTVRGIENLDQDFVAAMRAAGVADGALVTPQFIQPGVQRMFRGTLHDATHERLMGIDRAMQSFAATHRGVTIDGTQYFGDAADCPALEMRARQSAYEDAKNRAQAIASLSGVSVGATTNISENGGCASSIQQINAVSVYGAPAGFPIDIQTLTMRVTVSESMTFDLIRKP